MDLREGEKILKVYRRHFTPYLIKQIKVLIGAFPFFFMAFLFRTALSNTAYIIMHLSIFFLFALVFIYVTLIYWLDKLIITNKRIIFVNWRYLTARDEAEALLDDIQDIQTHERGLLSAINFFDYGTLRLDTASSYVTIEFVDAPDPEGIRKYIYHIKGNT